MTQEIRAAMTAAAAPMRLTKTVKLMDAAMAAQGIPSYYKLARVLGISDNTMTRWKQDRGSPADSMAARLAEMAGLDPGVVLAELAADRAPDDETRDRWRGIADRLRTAGLAVIVGAFCSFGAPPEARAYEVGQHADQSDAVRYVNLKKRRKAAMAGVASHHPIDPNLALP